ncbi:MAG: PLDc_N domain-containing protein [Phycisphaerales bacterium]|nr:PLDc_N domain-containing protein [Phycisphaerales bacterium]
MNATPLSDGRRCCFCGRGRPRISRIDADQIQACGHRWLCEYDDAPNTRAEGGFVLYTILGIVHLILWLIAAIEILGGSKPLVNKVIWLLVIFLLPLVGLVLYYLIGRGRR